jgi:hypothetical protein
MFLYKNETMSINPDGLKHGEVEQKRGANDEDEKKRKR